MTGLDLDAIRARCDAATPGPWVYLPYSRTLAADFRRPKPGDVECTVMAAFEDSDDRACDHDGAFVAAARADIPALLAAVVDLTAQLYAAEGSVLLRNQVAELQAQGVRLRAAIDDANRREGEARRAALKIATERDHWRDVAEARGKPLPPDMGLTRPLFAPLAAGHPHVQGRCPACGRAALFLGSFGHVTCARVDCPEPDAASSVLEEARCRPTADVDVTARIDDLVEDMAAAEHLAVVRRLTTGSTAPAEAATRPPGASAAPE